MLSSSSKSLLLISPQFPFPVNTGGREAIFGALKALARHHRITFLYFGKPSSVALPIENVEFIPLGDPKKPTFLFILYCLIRLKHFKFERYMNSFCETLVLPERNYDAIICFHPHVQKFMSSLVSNNQMRDVPRVLRSMNIESLIVEAYIQAKLKHISCLMSPLIFVAKHHEVSAWREFDSVIHISDADYHALSRFKGVELDRHFVVYDGLDQPKFKFSELERDRNVQLVLPVNLEAEQNIVNLKIFLLEYWAKIPVELRNQLKLTITGAGEEDLIRILGTDIFNQIKNSINAVGYVENYDRFIFGNVLISATFVGSGVRKKIMRAMSNDAAVLMSQFDFDSMKYFSRFPDSVFRSPKELESQLNLFKRDQIGYVLQRCHRQRILVSEYSWKRFFEEVKCFMGN